jgi:predicted enzyme related to lactoylglutathione lyase
MNSESTGRFIWYDLFVADPSAAIRFYTEVVGWKTQVYDASYTMWLGTEGLLGGTMKASPESLATGASPRWNGAVQVEDVERTAKVAQRIGGSLQFGPHHDEKVGVFAVLADPQGALLGVFQPKRGTPPHDRTKEGEFCWSELMTRDLAGALAFHEELFGWRRQEEIDLKEKGTYVVFGPKTERIGGMMKTPDGLRMPPTWVYYTETRDIDAALARAKANGARVMMPPQTVAEGAKIAQIVDPFGVLFAFHQAAGGGPR